MYIPSIFTLLTTIPVQFLLFVVRERPHFENDIVCHAMNPMGTPYNWNKSRKQHNEFSFPVI